MTVNMDYVYIYIYIYKNEFEESGIYDIVNFSKWNLCLTLSLVFKMLWF